MGGKGKKGKGKKGKKGKSDIEADPVEANFRLQAEIESLT